MGTLTNMDLMSISDVENRYRCANRFKGYLPFDGPFAIFDEHNPYCEILARMHSSYRREVSEGKIDGKRVEELEEFLEKMLRRECTEQEFKSWVNYARARVESGKEDEFLRYIYLKDFPLLE
jgi:hypothetical protein